MKSYAASLTLHIAGLLVAVAAGVYTLMHGLWFCTITSSAAVISLCVSLYRMQTRQIRLMRRIVDCMRGNDLSQLACPAFGDKETRQLAEDLSAALKAIRIRKAARLMLDNRGVLPEEIISAIRNRQTVVHLPHTPVPTDLSVSVTEIYLKGKSQWLVSLKNIHTALEHTEMEAWRKLIRVLTHEIMNSITPIISLADTLSERSLTESSDGRARSQMRQGLQVIRRRSKGLLEFVENYRKLTRIAQPVRTDIKVRDFFNDLQQLFAGETALTFSCPDSLPHWKADRGQMEQVFINLIRNALEACRNTADAHIEIGASISGKEWKFTVSDNGEGMLPEVTGRIFVPFFTTKPGGSGIGLALCKQIVILHGGQISVDSRPNKGSRFTLSFPA